jgi:hypothetical protein
MPCGIVLLFRRPDGRLMPRRMPCGVKACDYCGPRLRARLASQWAEAMAADQVFRLVVADGELAKLRRRKALAGHELGHVPGPDGTRVVYSTAPIGEPVADKIGALARDFAVMPNDSRRRFLSAGWAAVVADAEGEQAAKREPWECLGRVKRSLEHVEIIARELGLFLGRAGPDGLLVADPGDALLWSRFASLIGLVRGRRRRREAA